MKGNSTSFRRIIFSILLVLTSQSIFAQANLLFQKIGVEQGLSQSSVYSIYEDKQGFIWLGTGDGLNKFDGQDFTVYKSRFGDTGSNSIRERNINSIIIEDRYSRLWATSDAGLFCMNKKYRSFSLMFPQKFFGGTLFLGGIDANDSLWVASENRGLLALSVKNGGYTVYDPHKKNAGLKNLICTPEGIYLSYSDELILFDSRTHSFLTVLKNEKIESVHQLKNNLLLIGGQNEIILYNQLNHASEKIILTDKGNTKNHRWTAFAENSHTGTVYIGTGNTGTLCALDLKTKLYRLYNWQKRNITSLFIDRSENLWIGTDGGGMYKSDLKPEKFYSYPQKDIYNNKPDEGLMVKAIYRDDEGKIWIGSFNKGLIIYDPVHGVEKQVSLRSATQQEQLLVSSITKDSSGDILITAQDKIFWLDPANYRIKRQTHLYPQGDINFNHPQINNILEWKKGHYLVSTNQLLTTLTVVDGKISSPRSFWHLIGWVYKVQRSKDGNYYLGTREGYEKIRLLNDTIALVADKGLEELNIRMFYESGTHPFVWMASEEGLVVKNTKTKAYKVFDERNGLDNSYVYSILPENDSSLWLSTNSGISNARIYYTGDSVHVSFVNFTTKDGLQSNEFNTGAYYKCADGTLIFGGIEGINWFNPATLQLNNHKAIPFLSAIKVNDSAYAADTAAYVHQLNLPYRQNTLEFSFKALEFTDPDANSFAYKLQGFDKAWIYTKQGSVRYSNLPPGKYVFLLKASNNDGIWNDDPLTISLVILPPFWQTWWFRIIALISSMLVIILLSRYYTKQKLKAKTILLEKQQALYEERLRISKDLHDDLGSGLSKITLMADTASLSGNNEKINYTIGQISETSKDLIGNMRDLIWVLNPENTTLDNLAARIREYCNEYLEGLNINLTICFPEQIPSIPISREAQKNIFLTVKEAVHNSIKHAQASEIKITLQFDNDNLVLLISDNGIGFNTTRIINSGNGLRNMRLRIEQIKGTIAFLSDKKNGTLITIIVPLSKIAAL